LEKFKNKRKLPLCERKIDVFVHQIYIKKKVLKGYILRIKKHLTPLKYSHLKINESKKGTEKEK